MRKRLWGHDDETNRVVRRVVIQSDGEGAAMGSGPCRGGLRMERPIARGERGFAVPDDVSWE
jgi:hypothetical protein